MALFSFMVMLLLSDNHRENGNENLLRRNTTDSIHVWDSIHTGLEDLHGLGNAIWLSNLFLPLCPPIPPLYSDSDPYKTQKGGHIAESSKKGGAPIPFFT